MGTSIELGQFIINLTTTDNKTIIGELAKSKNTLDLQGKFTLSEKGLFEFTGTVSSDIDQTIYNAIAMFSNSQVKNGRLPIKYKQTIF
jgi:hypothetical protein